MWPVGHWWSTRILQVASWRDTQICTCSFPVLAWSSNWNVIDYNPDMTSPVLHPVQCYLSSQRGFCKGKWGQVGLRVQKGSCPKDSKDRNTILQISSAPGATPRKLIWPTITFKSATWRKDSEREAQRTHQIWKVSQGNEFSPKLSGSALIWQLELWAELIA